MTQRRAPHRWHLMLGTERLADLVEDGYDFPWIDVLVHPEPGLARLLLILADAERWPDDDPAFYALLAECRGRGGVRLMDEDGQEVSPYTLVNLDESRANLRL